MVKKVTVDFSKVKIGEENKISLRHYKDAITKYNEGEKERVKTWGWSSPEYIKEEQIDRIDLDIDYGVYHGGYNIDFCLTCSKAHRSIVLNGRNYKKASKEIQNTINKIMETFPEFDESIVLEKINIKQEDFMTKDLVDYLHSKKIKVFLNTDRNNNWDEDDEDDYDDDDYDEEDFYDYNIENYRIK